MSSKSNSLKFIELDPPKSLVFQRPFNTQKSRVLKIKNITDSTIVFKVKTTAPNNYIVVPNCGSVNINETCEIKINRNITNEEFPPDFKCKDKFLVQSMKINDDEIKKYSSEKGQLRDYLMTKFQEIDKQKKINPEDVKKILGEDRLTCIYALPNENIIQEALSLDELASSRESLNTTTVDAPSTVTAPAPVKSSSLATSKPITSNEEELIAAREKIKELQQALKGFQQDKAIHDLTKGTTTAARDVKATPAQMQLKKGAANKNVIPVEIVALVALLAFLIGAFCF